jgi:hypothetical protein
VVPIAWGPLGSRIGKGLRRARGEPAVGVGVGGGRGIPGSVWRGAGGLWEGAAPPSVPALLPRKGSLTCPFPNLYELSLLLPHPRTAGAWTRVPLESPGFSK